MNTQELYAYIDERLEKLSMDEKSDMYAGRDKEAVICCAKKNELLDLKAFIQTNERKLKS
jgi:hypothetical protein